MTDRKGGRPKSIGDPLFGAKGVEKFENWPTFGRKMTHCGQYVNLENALKMPKNGISGHFDKWPTLDFRKSISEPTPGHPLKSIPDKNISAKILTLSELRRNLSSCVRLIEITTNFHKFIERKIVDYFEYLPKSDFSLNFQSYYYDENC